MFHAIINITPVAKGRPRFGNGRTYTPQKTREAEECIGIIARGLYKGEPYAGAVRMDVTFYMPIPQSYSQKKKKELVGEFHTKKPDADNLVKTVCDSLNGIVISNDSQIADLRVKKMYGTIPHIEVQVSKL